MPLQYKSDPDSEGRRLVVCSGCGYKRLTALPREQVHHMCPASPDGKGAGWHLKQILSEAGAKPDSRCPCLDRAETMDDWGVDGCRENREVIIKWMKEAAFSRWFKEQVRIGWSLAHQPWFNPLDPFGSIVDEAIRRADQP